MPKFDGDDTCLQSFWDQVDAIIYGSDLPVITKFAHLNMPAEGKGKATIKGLSLTEANYSASCDLLKERYGHTEQIVFAHVQGLLNLSLSGAH